MIVKFEKMKFEKILDGFVHLLIICSSSEIYENLEKKDNIKKSKSSSIKKSSSLYNTSLFE